MNKTCYRCKISKPLDRFHRKGRWHQPYCKDCHIVYRREHYLANKQKYIDKAILWRNQARSKIGSYKEKPCFDCKIQYPYYVMQFDHLYDKEFNIAEVAGYKSMDIVKKEIEKCDVVCANCHAERTHNRKAGVTQSVECLPSK